MKIRDLSPSYRIFGYCNSDANAEQPTVARTDGPRSAPTMPNASRWHRRWAPSACRCAPLTRATDAPMQSVKLSDLLHEKSPVPEAEVAKSTVRVRRATEVEIVDIN